ncbi:DegV domain-containing protein TTE1491 [Geodia barretti]|uniref:DegV domain-containing protein TTE1491 n=1 Tax=Geodia barretti TaxID=519541 RepID=A0AA35XCS9_GEOBA|nr:DegV domain-containing protein TTE1491 [Geodia barretti]
MPPALAEQLGVTVVPANVVIDDVNYRDGIDLTADEFYQRLVAGPRLPTTSQPSVGTFQAAYQEILEQGDEIVSIHVSSKLSGTVNSAEQAKASLGDSVPIEVVDSHSASIAVTLKVLGAVDAARQSSSHREVADEVRRDLSRTTAVFALDTLEYLQKGGRVGKAQAFVGSLLSVKPILTLVDGEVHPLERPRNHQRAMRRLIELTREKGQPVRLGVIYSTEQEWATEIRSSLSDLLPEEEIVTARFGPALGTYVGPRAVGVALTVAE